jgi:hypothetical protein
MSKGYKVNPFELHIMMISHRHATIILIVTLLLSFVHQLIITIFYIICVLQKKTDNCDNADHTVLHFIVLIYIHSH